MKLFSPLEAFTRIKEAIERGRAHWLLGSVEGLPTKDKKDNVAMLMIGSNHAVQIENGIVISVGLTKEGLTLMRDSCEQALQGLSKQTS